MAFILKFSFSYVLQNPSFKLFVTLLIKMILPVTNFTLSYELFIPRFYNICRLIFLHIFKPNMIHKSFNLFFSERMVEKLNKLFNSPLLIFFHVFKPNKLEIFLIFPFPTTFQMVPIATKDMKSFLKKFYELIKTSKKSITWNK